MGKEIIKFDDIEIEKHKFHRYKSPILLEDVDIRRFRRFRFIRRFLLAKKAINALLVTCMMIMKLSHYI